MRDQTTDNQSWTLEEERTLQRMINGALRDTINAHGPIGPPEIGSASKRITGVIKGNFHLRHHQPPSKAHKNSRRPALAS